MIKVGTKDYPLMDAIRFLQEDRALGIIKHICGTMTQ